MWQIHFNFYEVWKLVSWPGLRHNSFPKPSERMVPRSNHQAKTRQGPHYTLKGGGGREGSSEKWENIYEKIRENFFSWKSNSYDDTKTSRPFPSVSIFYVTKSVALQFSNLLQEDLHFAKIFGFGKTVSRCRKSSHGIVTNKQDLCKFLSISLYIFKFDPEPLYRGTVKACPKGIILFISASRIIRC